MLETNKILTSGFSYFQTLTKIQSVERQLSNPYQKLKKASKYVYPESPERISLKDLIVGIKYSI